jgi:hypothetical protein
VQLEEARRREREIQHMAEQLTEQLTDAHTAEAKLKAEKVQACKGLLCNLIGCSLGVQ